ncbi:MAG: ATP-binding cassette domain-containing protein, partial [Longimicrobiales bacterium]
MIQFPRCTKRYGSLEAVRDLTLTIAPGEVHVLLGRNGAGKATAFRCLATLLKPSWGTASLFSWRSNWRSALQQGEKRRSTLETLLTVPVSSRETSYRNVRGRGAGRCRGGPQSRWHAAHVPTRAHSGHSGGRSPGADPVHIGVGDLRDAAAARSSLRM